MEKTKKCKTCGKLFVKKVNCSKRDWELSKFCSRKCINVGRPSPFKGSTTRWSEDWKTKMSEFNLGFTSNTGRTHIEKGQHLSTATEFKKGQVSPWKGKPNPRFQGPNNPRWNGGITPEHLKIRWSKKYKDFRDKVFERDNYTCRFCKRKRKIGDRVVLNAHHIKSFAVHKKLRLIMSNVITLCRECHKDIHS